MLIGGPLWTRGLVAGPIRMVVGITMTEQGVGTWLRRHGFTPQRPARRAYQQQQENVSAWPVGNAERIEPQPMPGYSPELDPDEISNADIKRHVHASRARSADDPARESPLFLDRRRRRRQRHIVRRHFHARHVRYTLR
ncbi:winged helix-turn-helix domain-containing protein [Streptomyces rubradiris]|uniref:Winged helix-turn helix domain-containing protein n=1 Tax=Streptomyces rubradiris TaxID=285531 RepID=A0ABQ3RKL0_STRRR|nr:winged helix-turn-helix domain-containing protein [Streptomyces rubradiris]GHH27420.1 hypothetical protein GCM10018792_69660 [Streptomyces rubradiris]GHI56391.1 hypothetical protein Srubr_62370 [Streptomyces rubradiris]